MPAWSAPLRVRLRRFRKERFDNLAVAAFVVLIAALTAYVGLWSRPGERFDLWVLQTFFRVRGDLSPPPDVVVVALDDESYIKLNASTRWPFPRRASAEVLERVVAAGPKVVILDLNTPDEAQDPEANDRLERAMRSGPVTISTGAYPMGKAVDVEANPAKFVLMAPSAKRFLDAARMQLDMWLLSDFDYVSQIAANADPSAPPAKRIPLGRALVELGGYDVVPPGPRDLINFYGGKGTLQRLSFADVLDADEATLRRSLASKVVLVGYQSLTRGRGQMDKDEFNVPISDLPMFGVEIHATIAANLMDRSWLRRLRPSTELQWVALGSLAIGFVGLFLRFKQAVVFVLSAAVLAVVASYQLFAHHQLWLPLVGPVLLCGTLTLLANQTIRYFKAERTNRMNKDFWDFELEDD